MGEVRPGNRADRMLVARKERVERLRSRAQEWAPVGEPVVWRARWGGLLVAALLLGKTVHYSRLAEPLAPGVRGVLEWLLLQAGVTLVWACFACAVGNWGVVAHRPGIWVRRAGSTRHVDWERIERVDVGRFGRLGIRLKDQDEPWLVAGFFLPPALCRALRLRDGAQEAADLLTVLALHPELRPRGGAGHRRLGHPWVIWPAAAVWVYGVVTTLS